MQPLFFTTFFYNLFLQPCFYDLVFLLLYHFFALAKWDFS